MIYTPIYVRNFQIDELAKGLMLPLEPPELPLLKNEVVMNT